MTGLRQGYGGLAGAINTALAASVKRSQERVRAMRLLDVARRAALAAAADDHRACRGCGRAFRSRDPFAHLCGGCA